MNFAFTLTLLLSVVIAAVYCNHDHNHHSNHGDDKWITFVSQIESFWKTETPSKTPEAHTESSLNNKDVYSSEKTSAVENHKPTTDVTLLNGTTYNDVSEGVKMSLAAIISIPIVGIIIVVCCFYWICKCCCGMCRDEQQGHVICTNSNVVQPQIAQPTQVILQQPIYQQVSPPQQVIHQYPPPHQQYGMQQFQQHGQPQFQLHGQPQFQQHGQPQFQQQMPPPQYYENPKDGIENPNFYHASAPPHSPEKY